MMTFKTLALAGALALALVSPPAQADPISDALDSLFGVHRVAPHRARLHHHDSGRRRYRAPVTIGASETTPLLEVARRYVGAGNFTGLRAPWCMASMRVWLARAGYEAPRSNRAIDGLRIGVASAPRVGAVAVMPHHIGVVAGFTPRGPLILSGNHNNRVGYGVYSPRRIVGYRWPK